MKKIVLTGAAGRLGGYLRGPLSNLANTLVSTDISDDIGDLAANESFVQADLADKPAIHDIIEGADMVVHFGALVDEASFESILGPNIIGSYNVWEAASLHGVRRVIYASSIHAVGMYPKNQHIGVDVAHRPDGFYGLAKCFSEDLARMYWEKRGLETVCLRILSCAAVTNPRALGSWLSPGDLVRLVKRSIDTPVTGFTVAYGVSANDRSPVDNSAAQFLGYRPQDNAEQFADDILAKSGPLDPLDGAHMCHGGPFATTGLGVSAMAALKLVDD
ncbi:MAG: NAD(P)-dependent oxidoreductase [Rhodobacteraceae bacterium]|nr:NAD(P)-dependent oxidoreductase [Paracoccaceae bacterium]